MIIKGTTQMQRYPGSIDGMARYKGIKGYGWTQYNGQRVLKVPHRNLPQLESIGYRHIGDGRSYAYVAPPC